MNRQRFTSSTGSRPKRPLTPLERIEAHLEHEQQLSRSNYIQQVGRVMFGELWDGPDSSNSKEQSAP